MPYLSTQNYLDYFSNSFAVPAPTSANLLMSADTFWYSGAATTNYDADNYLGIGEINTAAGIGRAWIKPDFTGIPAGAAFITAVLYLTPILDRTSNERTMRAHRCLRDVVSNQATWNIWKTSNNWGTAGCSNSSTDYDGAVEMGNRVCPAAPTLNVAVGMTLSAAELQKLFDGTHTNNGIVLFMDTQTDDMTQYASTNHATAGYRPYITITYL